MPEDSRQLPRQSATRVETAFRKAADGGDPWAAAVVLAVELDALRNVGESVADVLDAVVDYLTDDDRVAALAVLQAWHEISSKTVAPDA